MFEIAIGIIAIVVGIGCVLFQRGLGEKLEQEHDKYPKLLWPVKLDAGSYGTQYMLAGMVFILIGLLCLVKGFSGK